MGCVAAACLGLPAPGTAASLEAGRYVAEPGEVNRLTLTYDANGFLNYNDPGATITVIGPECEYTDAPRHSARCANVAPRVDLGDGDDTITAEITPVMGASIAGGPGADELVIRGGGFVHGDREDWDETHPDDGPDRITVEAPVANLDPEREYDMGSRASIVYAGGGNDQVSVRGYANEIYGESGDDVLTGDDAHPPKPNGRSCSTYGLNGCVPIVVGEACLKQYIPNDIVHGGAGDDRISGRSGNDRLFGEDGGDTVDGGDDCDLISGDHARYSVHQYRLLPEDAKGGGPDVLDGGTLDDQLYGGPGDDSLAGGEGDDRLIGSAGGDVHDGGPGTDSTSYSDHAGPITVSLDSHGGDGEAGEGDRVAPDLERVFGTRANDRLVGSSATNELNGWAGDDVIVGGGGPHDVLLGEGGSDTILAREGEPGVNLNWIPWVTYNFDDSISCDGDEYIPPPPGVPEWPEGDPGPRGANDTVTADPADRFGAIGCESVLYSDTPIVVDPESTRTVTAPGYCDPGVAKSLCRATATVMTTGGKRLGKRAYAGRRGAKRKRIVIPVSRSAARRARGGKRVKAVVAYRHRKK